MDQPIEIRRKRLKFQSWHRGTKESDLILGRFADRYLDTFGDAELDAYEQLLDCPDPEIFDWISGRAAVPGNVESPVTKLLLKFDISAQDIDRY
ncbi:antitoxin CptB [Constrictibacter sp. MBR-5]|jgi:antitoxin CptB|uniref:FAD assembly factor SdhE n=1 Tax=Constrictibacter sp. MBR-5 TaxID=3156467 RepID=UPI003397023D